eukprot:TRINITY_DN954_c0_g1_i1.p1 TRINITY_DN954_c0_g1~~TRINITY_DN954_c0_g1_i1.p1  ORF type:complete len:635 (+),score=192.94 TRINITY_DN954_c0_g1_i1:104-2008(+)
MDDTKDIELVESGGNTDPTPGKPAVPPPETVRWFLRLLFRHFIILSFALIALVVSVVANVILPFAAGKAIDDVEEDALVSWLLVLLAILTVGAIGSFFRGSLFAFLSEIISKETRFDLFRSILGQPISFFDTHGSGTLVSLFSSDGVLLQLSIARQLPNLSRFSLQVIFGVGFLFFLSWDLTLVMLVSVPFLGIAGIVFSRWIRKLSTDMQNSYGSISHHCEETFESIHTIQALGIEDRHKEQFSAHSGLLYSIGKRLSVAWGSFQGTTEWIAYAGVLVVLWYGAKKAKDNDITKGELLSFLLFTVITAHAMGGISHVLGDLFRGLAAAERIRSMISSRSNASSSTSMEEKEEEEEEEDDTSLVVAAGVRETAMKEPYEVANGIQAEIRFDNVSFAYPSRPDHVVLDHLNLSIPFGKIFAIVGASGTGKSTMIQLLMRFYEPLDGTIHIGGRQISKISLRTLRQQVAYVPQSVHLFSGTVLENISLQSPGEMKEEDHENMVRCARIAGVDDFVHSLPSEYLTEIGEKGACLSGGQRQRIAVARALYRKPEILVMDEATSALDVESEQLIQRALIDLQEQLTVIVIAHRMATVQIANKIVVVEDGHVVEEGTHQELMDREGSHYAKLLTSSDGFN